MTVAAPFGRDLFGDPIGQGNVGALAQRYVVPPFDVLDGRSDAWKQRKAMWNALHGFDSSSGRLGGNGWNETALANGLGEWLDRVDNDGARTDFAHGRKQHRVSVFCPVLAEVLVSWFSEPGDIVFDPFAGGSVRGIVSAVLGRRYTGIDLRVEQCAENARQADALGIDGTVCTWLPGNGVGEGLEHAALSKASLVFTCPPYGTLERYSDDPADLSTMEWDAFAANIEAGIRIMEERARPGAFVVYVVADYREKAGGTYTALRPLVALVTQALSKAPFQLHASAVYLTPLGTLPIRSAHNFRTARKLGRAHQNVIVARVEK